MRLREVCGDHAEHVARAALERRRLNGADAGVEKHFERWLPGKDWARRDVLDDHTVAAGKGGAACRCMPAFDRCEELDESRRETRVHGDLERVGRLVVELDVALLGTR